MTTIFITGGTSGLGYESARQLVALGHRVIIGADGPTGTFTDRLGELGWRLQGGHGVRVALAHQFVRRVYLA